MRAIWNDIRHGLRMLAASPGFTAVAILSLAIGIGANTSTFSLADALVLRPLPVPRSSEIVRVLSTSPSGPREYLSYLDYTDLSREAHTVTGLIASWQVPIGFSKDSKSTARPKLGLAVSTNFFDVLTVQPSLGRAFRSDEDRRNAIVLSDTLWESEFGRDPSILGRTVSLSNANFTIIGVAPKSFTGLDRFVHEDFYVPLGTVPQFGQRLKQELEQRDALSVTVFGRLAPGRSARQAQAEFQAIGQNLEGAYPATNRGRGVLAMSEFRSRFLLESLNMVTAAVLLGIAICVLLIACANVANLLLSRGRARARELAIRVAIGASRKRLFQQLITESLVLAVIGAAFGLVLVLFSIDFFASLRIPASLPVWLVVRPDLRVLLFAFATTLVSAVVFGVAPAVQALRSDVSTTLKAGDAAPSAKRRWLQGRNALVVAQIAISMMLLVSSGLLVKDFSDFTAARAGFRIDHVLVMSVNPAMVGYNESQGAAFYRELLDRLHSLPAVPSAAFAQHIPLGFSSSSRDIVVEGFQMPPAQRSITVTSNIVSDGYFSLMRIPILAGRSFEAGDLASSLHIAIVNEAMAKKYWPRGNAIGGRFRMNGKETIQVVGVAKTIKYRDASEPPLPFLYLPLSQQYSSFITLHVETLGDPASIAALVVGQISAIDRAMPVSDVQTLEHFFKEGALFGSRLVMQVVLVIGSFGLLLAVVGLYGVIAYSVSRRTREIGIRMAIGAQPSGVARLVLRQGLTLILIGTAIGLVLALGASQVVASQLAGTSPFDPLVYFAGALVLGSVSLLACYVPARRAARVDPLVALRQD
jgi:macrolide transport system ATP-binding/permease protein